MADHDLPSASTAAEAPKKLRPNEARGYYLAGLIARDDGRLDEGAANLERALELQPDSLEILTSLTQFQSRAGPWRYGHRASAASA